ncbi:MAG: hypothetical protein PHH54_02550 [Candidatus Nanoarchaeia archaeon]|nr:hypothetical protein [Candidatus Nanoarchaeia archaeon]MDD5740841.1 hypothetical protein [Candidatus Nanoarchaeia archaeon]
MKKYLPLILCGLSLIGCRSTQSDSQMIKRDNIVIPISFSLEEAVGANKLLLDFPNTIPGAESVDKYLIPDAKYCFVHVRQAHLNGNPKYTKKEHLEWIEKVQNNIYDILSSMIKNQGVKEIYDEGLPIFFQNGENLYAKIHYRLNNTEIDPNFIKDAPSKIFDLNEIKKENLVFYEGYLEFEEKMKYNAINRLASEGKIKILAAENYDLLKKADAMDKKTKGFGFYRKFFEKEKLANCILEDREDYFLKTAGEQKNPLIVVVYGGRHAFGGKGSCSGSYDNRDSIKDNIGEWNLKNPENKFSLIEITPYGLD